MASSVQILRAGFLTQVKKPPLYPTDRSVNFQRLSIRALVITLTELSAMAPPAITGLR